MASSPWSCFDDITTVLDDVATMTGRRGQKTAGGVGDDLALNAQQVTGVNADRELPVGGGQGLAAEQGHPGAGGWPSGWRSGPTPLLMVGGATCASEGFEKLAHKFLHSKAEDEAHHQQLVQATSPAST